MDFKKKFKRCLKELFTTILAFTMVLTTGLSEVYATNLSAPEYNKDIELTMKWQVSGNEQADNLDIHATTPFNTQIKQRISYKGNKVSRDYGANELSIVVKGLKRLYRTNNLEATQVGADKQNSTTKLRDWTYSYNFASDEYTFTNNHKINKDTTLDGFFDIIYEVNPKKTVHNLKLKDKDALSCMLYYPDGTCNKSNSITLNNQTDKSTYRLGIKQGTTSSDSGLNGYVNNKSDYVLLRYDLSTMVTEHARDLQVEKYMLTFPMGFVVCNNNVNAKHIKNDDSNKYSVELSKNGYFYVACPKSYLGRYVTIIFELNGFYYEDTRNEPYEIASRRIQTWLPSDFKYSTPSGVEYDLQVKANKDNPLLSSYIQSPTGQNVSYEVKTSYYFQKDYNVEMETVIDHHFISKKNGLYRQLNDDEYDINYISTRNTQNDALDQVKTGYYEIYACNSSVFKKGEVPFETGDLANLKNRQINLPEGTKSVGIIYKDVHEAFTSPIDVGMNIHNVGDDTLFETGRVLHSAYTRMFVYDKEWNNRQDRTVNSVIDVPGVDERALDIKNYGNINLTRDGDNENITLSKTDRNNYISTYAGFRILEQESPTHLNATGTLSGIFDFKDDVNKPAKFSLYTILPKDVNLTYVNHVNEIFDNVHIINYNSNVSNDYLTQHCKPIMIKNYKNSGRTYLAFKFDLKHGDLNSNSSVSVNMGLTIESEELGNAGYTGRLQSYLTYDDKNLPIYSRYLYRDDGSSCGGNIYADINQNDSEDDFVAAAEAQDSLIYASSGEYGIKKYIKGSKDNVYTSEKTFTEIGKEYSYALEITTGTSTLKDIVIHEDLEAAGEVKGRLKSISFSKGYSGEYDKDNHTIKIKQSMTEGKKLRVYITLEMPKEMTFIGKTIKNNFSLKATVINNSGDIKQEDGLQSNDTEAEVTSRKTTLSIRKIDAKTKEPLSGAQFGIYADEESDKPIEIKNSNANGYTNFKKLDYGKTYYVKELKAPKGYKIAKCKKVVADKDFVELEFEDSRVLGTIKVTKKSDLDKDAKLPGAKFNLSLVNGINKKHIASATTGSDGSLTFENLEWGQYELEEIEAPKGYSISNKITKVDVNGSNVTDKNNKPTVINADVVDRQDDVLAVVNKLAKDVKGNVTDEPLLGAKFILYRVDDEDNYDLSDSKTSKVMGVYYTNEEGKISVGRLAYGTYVFHESMYPIGYESGKTKGSLKRDDHVFKLSPEQKEVDLTVYNKRKGGTIAILKTDGDKHIVPGAKFTLYDKDMIPISEDVSVNEEGTVVFENLEWGTYYIKETKAPYGYDADKNPYEVTIKASQLFHRLEIVNNQIPGAIKLKKVDSNTKSPLKNAEFNLCKNDGTSIATLTTNEKGEADYENLPWGSYYLEETKAPDGYAIDTTKHRFAVNAYTSGKTQTLEIENKINENKSFKLIKRIKKDDIWKPHGQVVFNYNVSYKDISGNIIYRNVSLNFENYKTVKGTEYVEASATLDKIPSNVTEVRVYEYGTNRYKTANVTDKEGKSLEAIQNSTNQYFSYTLPLVKGDGSDLIYFKNDKVNWKDYSDSSSIVNTIAKKDRLTSITVINNGKVKPKEQVDMTVVANYDDGTHEEISPSEYVITKHEGLVEKDGKLYWPNKAGTYIIEVQYKHFKDSITGTIDPQSVIYDPYLVHNVSTIIGNKAGQLNVGKNSIKRIVFSTNKAPSSAVNAEQMDDKDSLEDLKPSIVAWMNGSTLHFSTQNPAKRIKLPVDSSNQFNGFGRLEYIEGTEILITNHVTNMAKMFANCGSLTSVDLTTWDTSNVTDMSYMFDSCSKMNSLDVSNFDTSKVTNMSNMFNECKELTTLNVSNWNTSQVTDMSYLFKWCFNLTTPDVSRWDTSKVTNMSNMFSGIEKLTTLNVSDWNTSQVTDMSLMFANCGFSAIDVSRFNTGRVTTMRSMFFGCASLTNLNLNSWNTSSVADMSDMFANCNSIRNIELRDWNTSKVENFCEMFTYCENLEYIDVSKWDTSSAKNMQSMFGACRGIKELNLTNWNTSHVETMGSMFAYCDKLIELDLSNFDTTNVGTICGMFSQCTKLRTIYVSNAWSLYNLNAQKFQQTYEYVFSACKSIVGQSGKRYDSSRVDASMANYQNGYFTYRRGNRPIKLDYMDGRLPRENYDVKNTSDLYTPQRSGYKFDGWYYEHDLALEHSINDFKKVDNAYSWSQDSNGVWSSNNNGISSQTEARMLSEKFTLTKKGKVSFQWRSAGYNNYNYLGYDILDVNKGIYLSGYYYPNAYYCLESLKDGASKDYKKVIKELEPGTYQLQFIFMHLGRATVNEDKGFVKNVTYGENLTDVYKLPVGKNELLPDEITLYAKWIKQ